MRILLADDHDLLRDTLGLFFEKENDIDVEFARDLPSAMERLEGQDDYDLVLLDYGMPGMNGLDGLKKALGSARGARIGLISGVAPRTIAERALEMGAAGFLPKTLPARSLVNAVRFMASGEKYAPLDFMTTKPEDEPGVADSGLLPREVEVLRGLCQGKTNKEIARDLDIREPTVKLYVKTLFRKIGVKNRTQAALYAKDAGIL